MTLANVVPQVGPDPKTGVSGMGTFVGGSNPFPAPCAGSPVHVKNRGHLNGEAGGFNYYYFCK